jgi:hypothetical protein
MRGWATLIRAGPSTSCAPPPAGIATARKTLKDARQLSRSNGAWVDHAHSIRASRRRRQGPLDHLPIRMAARSARRRRRTRCRRVLRRGPQALLRRGRTEQGSGEVNAPTRSPLDVLDDELDDAPVCECHCHAFDQPHGDKDCDRPAGVLVRRDSRLRPLRNSAAIPDAGLDRSRLPHRLSLLEP